MSQAAEIILTGASTNSLLERIENIRKWDGGKNYEIMVQVEGVGFTYDTINNVEIAIKTDLVVYINKKFNIKDKIFKTDGNDDLYVVDDPNKINEDNNKVKRRNSLTNITPKKKKKKRNKKTHRRK